MEQLLGPQGDGFNIVAELNFLLTEVNAAPPASVPNQQESLNLINPELGETSNVLVINHYELPKGVAATEHINTLACRPVCPMMADIYTKPIWLHHSITLRNVYCNLCNDITTFETLPELVNHFAEAHDRRLPCAVCKSQFTIHIGLEEHVVKRHLGSFPKKQAYKRLREKFGLISLSVHNMIHFNTDLRNALTCLFCFSLFKSFTSLVDHIRNNHPMFCKLCGICFKTITEFKSHQHYHEIYAVMNYCNECSFSSQSRSNMTAHTQEAHGSLTFSSKVEKVVISKTDLGANLSKGVICAYCGKAKTPVDLVKHVLNHHFRKCPLCKCELLRHRNDGFGNKKCLLCRNKDRGGSQPKTPNLSLESDAPANKLLKKMTPILPAPNTTNKKSCHTPKTKKSASSAKPPVVDSAVGLCPVTRERPLPVQPSPTQNVQSTPCVQPLQDGGLSYSHQNIQPTPAQQTPQSTFINNGQSISVDNPQMVVQNTCFAPQVGSQLPQAPIIMLQQPSVTMFQSPYLEFPSNMMTQSLPTNNYITAPTSAYPQIFFQNTPSVMFNQGEYTYVQQVPQNPFTPQVITVQTPSNFVAYDNSVQQHFAPSNTVLCSNPPLQVAPAGQLQSTVLTLPAQGGQLEPQTKPSSQ